MSDNKFIPGLFFKDPHQNAPDFVMAKGSIKVADLRAWLAEQPGEWINFDLKRSREGKPYAQLDTWVPDRERGGGRGDRQERPKRQAPADDFDSDTIPF